MNKSIVICTLVLWILLFEATYLIYFLYNLIFKFSFRNQTTYLNLIEQYSENLKI